MGLNDFAITKERALPIFILADVSGSMRGMKIQAVNKAIQDMVATLRNVDDIRGVFKLCIITFGGNDEVIVQQLPTDIKDVEITYIDIIRILVYTLNKRIVKKANVELVFISKLKKNSPYVLAYEFNKHQIEILNEYSALFQAYLQFDSYIAYNVFGVADIGALTVCSPESYVPLSSSVI